MGERKAVTNKMAAAYRRGTRAEKSADPRPAGRAHRLAPGPRPGPAAAGRARSGWSGRVGPARPSTRPGWSRPSSCAGGSAASRRASASPRCSASSCRCLRRDGELDLTDARGRGCSVRMSPATIDRRLRGPRSWPHSGAAPTPSPGRLLKSQIPIRTWSEWDEAVPGFCRDRPGRPRGRERFGEFCFTLTMTDVATGLDGEPLGQEQGGGLGHRGHRPRRGGASRSRSSASTRTTAPSSSTPTSSSTAPTPRSPSPGPGRATRTTGPTSSRRTGPTSASWSATCASTPPPSSACSTGSGSSTGASPTSCSPSRSSSAGPGSGPRSSSATTAPPPPTNGPSTPACSPRPSAGRSPGPATPSTPASSSARSPACATSSNASPSRRAPASAAGRQPGLHGLLGSRRFYVRQRFRVPGGFDVRQQGSTSIVPDGSRPPWWWPWRRSFPASDGGTGHGRPSP